MKRFRQMTALLLAAVIVLSLAACGSGAPTAGQHPQAHLQHPFQAPVPAAPAPSAQEFSAPTEPVVPAVTPLGSPAESDRESLEQIADLLGTGEDYSDLSDEELTDLIESELQTPEATIPEEPAADPVADPEENSDSYDEQGAMSRPFDQIYPELIETEQVAYDETTLLLKLPLSMGGTITEEMAAAGVGELELLFEVERAGWYEAKLILGTDVPAAVESLRAVEDILLVDYNYQVHTADLGGFEEIPEALLTNPKAAEQWYLGSCGIPSGIDELTTPGGDRSIIVAVIDTGVDYDHEDLSGNIWFNENEIPDDGIDNDGNGYTDDYYGVNIVHGSGSGDDDNGHGTHVAGIIAAQNNNLGTVGIAYNVRVMPIKAAMASGYLNQADIARAILYAHQNGAQVINMSFGGTACSIAVQDALAMAYADCVLVASAGNSGAPNQGLGAIPNYPAALSYVLGVMSVDANGKESSFSNYDVAAFNGVEYELYAPGEGILSTIPGDRYASWSGTSMSAPVVSAMAALLRSAYSDPELYPTKFIYGQLTATSDSCAACLNPSAHGMHNLPQIVNLYSALTEKPTPEVGMSEHYWFDTPGFEPDEGGVNNGDGVIDAGETIALGLVLRNRWGKADNTIVTLDTLSPADIPDPYITIHNAEVNYGSVGTYSDQDAGRIYTGDLLTGWEKPFYITIAPDCPNDYIAKINVTITCRNGLDSADSAVYESSGEILLTVRSGKILPNIIDQDMVLTADNLYIIPNTTIIRQGVTVTVEPGTNIQFWSDDPNDPYADSYIAELVVDGNFLVEGTAEAPVRIFPAECMDHYPVKIGSRNDGYVSLIYAEVTNALATYNSSTTSIEYAHDGIINYAERCTFRMNYTDCLYYRELSSGQVREDSTSHGQHFAFIQARDCVFYKNALSHMYVLIGNFDRCVFADCGLEFPDGSRTTDCLFLGNNHTCLTEVDYTGKNLVIPSTLQLPESDQYTHSLERFGYYETEDVTLFYTPSNNTLAKQSMEMLGYPCLTIESEEMVDWLMMSWDVIGSCFQEYSGTDEPEVGSTHDWIFVVPGSDWNTARIVDQFAERGINPGFYGNVVLNRISTDFDINHWLRVEAPEVDAYTEVPLGHNYWGTTDDRAIGLQILDYADFPATYALLNYKPFLTEAPENTFPYVTDVTIFNRDGDEIQTAANEEITVRITFNRDMDTSIPLSVQYGSSYPYRDYTIEGEYVDARTWEGTKLLTTVIENGTQYFVISNGRSAEEDLVFCTDEARFAFELDTAAAQALIMQGEARTDGIHLTWMQDDFDTLMGYNVYRSDSEDGYYQRINDVIIPAETKEFFDDTVEPGVVYYYNFTVVQTDLTESTPSGKITIQALDTMAPNIYHTPVYNAKTGANLVLTATVTDNLHVTAVTLYYRVTGEDAWHTAMMNGLNSKYTAIIPAMYVTIAGLEYYIEATDGISTTARGSAEDPYRITVTQAQDASALGDVNGDGTITPLDALMLLQAINDLLNLDAQQFERADLNGDGQLTASEALKILQYVNGTIGSLNG